MCEEKIKNKKTALLFLMTLACGRLTQRGLLDVSSLRRLQEGEDQDHNQRRENRHTLNPNPEDRTITQVRPFHKHPNDPTPTEHLQT